MKRTEIYIRFTCPHLPRITLWTPECRGKTRNSRKRRDRVREEESDQYHARKRKEEGKTRRHDRSAMPIGFHAAVISDPFRSEFREVYADAPQRWRRFVARILLPRSSVFAPATRNDAWNREDAVRGGGGRNPGRERTRRRRGNTAGRRGRAGQE